MTIEAQAAYVTEVQQACRNAKQTRSRIDLSAAMALMEDARFDGLDRPVKLDLQEAYRAAFGASTGAGAP